MRTNKSINLLSVVEHIAPLGESQSEETIGTFSQGTFPRDEVSKIFEMCEKNDLFRLDKDQPFCRG
jgi:hypothetical protein